MPNQKDAFLDQIPEHLKEGSQMHHTSDMSVFRPRCYATGTSIQTQDYHICLPISTPPPLIIEGTEYIYQKGRIIILPPDTSIEIEKHCPTLPYIALNISKAFFDETAAMIAGRKQKTTAYMNHPYSKHLISLIYNFENELKQYRDTCPLMLQSISTQIVIQVLRESGMITLQARRPAAGKNYMDRALEYMRAYYNANIRIEDICKQIHLSPYYFIRMFRESIGMTPHEYLLKIRIEKAAELLRMGSYSIEEVSGLIGFVSPAHFSSTFRKVMGIPPSEYKKKYHEITK